MIRQDAAGESTDRFPQTLWDAADTAPMQVMAHTQVQFCVLASSSAGNCSMIIFGRERTRRVVLLDCGLSPRRTARLLHEFGLDLTCIDEIILTHLDADHCHVGWAKALPRHARLRLHERHLPRAARAGLRSQHMEVFDDAPFDLRHGARITPTLLAHDEYGVAAFRFDFDSDAGSLGYATDIGRPSKQLVSLLAGVETLAIESNYCPRLQVESDRPDFLKQRIMNGNGHLSNEQSQALIRAIRPRRSVVLLHLSRQCNSPALAASYHQQADYELVIASHDRPTALLALQRTPPRSPAVLG